MADRLEEIFKSDRAQFEEKWDNLKLFIQYGMLSDEKFYDRGAKFALLKKMLTVRVLLSRNTKPWLKKIRPTKKVHTITSVGAVTRV